MWLTEHFQTASVIFFVKNNMMLKGIVHPKRKIWCLSAYPEGIQDVGDFISSVEHKQRLLTRTVAVCQSYNVSQWDPRLWETKKTYTDKTKLNPVAHDNTMKSYDTKQSVCARNWTVFISFITSDSRVFTTSGAWQKYCLVSCTDRLFRVWRPQCIVTSHRFNLVLSVYVFCFVSQSRGSHWLTLYDWQTATVRVNNLRLCSTEEIKSPTSWMPSG